MNPSENIRWKQRFQNFKRAFMLLRSALEDRELDTFSDLEKEGIIQRFEYTFELSWKTFKDYLDFSGIAISEATPRKVIKQCAASGIFATANINPETYMNMMLERNLLSHTYDFERFVQALVRIKNEYLTELDKQYDFFITKELEEDG